MNVIATDTALLEMDRIIVKGELEDMVGANAFRVGRTAGVSVRVGWEGSKSHGFRCLRVAVCGLKSHHLTVKDTANLRAAFANIETRCIYSNS